MRPSPWQTAQDSAMTCPAPGTSIVVVVVLVVVTVTVVVVVGPTVVVVTAQSHVSSTAEFVAFCCSDAARSVDVADAFRAAGLRVDRRLQDE
jgi:hypothetical protein